jgi:hypothetical protein
MTEVAKMSPVSGKVNKMDLPITEEEHQLLFVGRLVAKIWPKLTEEQREFLRTGRVPEDK